MIHSCYLFITIQKFESTILVRTQSSELGKLKSELKSVLSDKIHPKWEKVKDGAKEAVKEKDKMEMIGTMDYLVVANHHSIVSHKTRY